jgi:guanylate kinase
VDRRLQAARDELAAAEEFDCVLVNADVRECAQSLLALVVDPTSVPRGLVPHPDDPTDE